MPGTDHDHALVGNHIFAHVLAVVAAAHFDDDHYFAELAVDFDVTQADNIVGQEGDGVMAEFERIESIFNLDGGHNRHASAGQCGDHAVERFPEVLSETWCQGHFETDQ